jgi:hypothetical protein
VGNRQRSRYLRVRRIAPLTLIAISAVLASALITPGSATGAPIPVAAAPAAAASTDDAPLSIDQAVAQAVQTDTAVPVPASTTETSTVTANPDGTVAVSSFVAPVRKKVNGSWKPLDATLQRHADGSISAAVTSQALSFGAPGSTRLATQGTGPSAFTLDVPFTLPEPTLAGDTATYPNVLSGVDLVATADEQGGFSEVFVIKTAAAAANPAVSTLALSASVGQTFSSDAGANITAKDATGNPIATAPTPLMWDSTAPAEPVTTSTDPTTGQAIDTATGQPALSTTDGAGEAAQVLPIDTATTGRTLELTPSTELLASSSTVWPVYVDPSWSNPHKGGNNNSWATVRSAWPDTSYVKTSGPLSSGYQGWDSPYFKSRAFIQWSLDSAFHGSTVKRITIDVPESYAPSCTDKRVDLYHTGHITSTTTWDNQPTKGAYAGNVTAAHGYNTSCPGENIAFNDNLTDTAHPLVDIIQTGADNDWTKVAFGLYAHDETDKYAWKKFDHKGSNLTIYYDHAPKTPTTKTMSTSPKTVLSTATTCASPPTGRTTLGKGDVTFSVTGSDPDGGIIGLGYGLFKNSSQTQIAGISGASTANMVTSGTTFNWRVDQSVFDDNINTDANGAPIKTGYYWRVHVYDGYFFSDWSPLCHFIYDPTIPGLPTASTTDTNLTVGTPASFTISPPTSGTAPATYLYSLNDGKTKTVNAIKGVATIDDVTPTRIIGNILTIAGVSTGGNIGDSNPQPPFDAAAPPAYADNDLNGDNVPDQLTVGGTTGTPAPGLWLAEGTGAAGQFTTATQNIGTDGIGNSDTGSSSEFNTGKAITGLFTGGTTNGATQDQLIYYPKAGNAVILPGNADGTIQTPVSATATTISSLQTDDGYMPTQVVNAGNTSGSDSAFPDLLATAGPDGSSLSLYVIPDANNAGLYNSPVQLTNTTPDGTTDWTPWRLASAQHTSSGTNLYLWNTTTKALYLWKSTTYVDNDDGTGTLTGTQYTIATAWKPANVNSFEAADLNADGTTDLRVINTAGTATAYLVTNLPTATTLGTPGTTIATVTAKTAQTLSW